MRKLRKGRRGKLDYKKLSKISDNKLRVMFYVPCSLMLLFVGAVINSVNVQENLGLPWLGFLVVGITSLIIVLAVEKIVIVKVNSARESNENKLN